MKSIITGLKELKKAGIRIQVSDFGALSIQHNDIKKYIALGREKNDRRTLGK